MPWERIELICAGRIGVEDEFRYVQSPRWPSTVVAGIRAGLDEAPTDEPPCPRLPNSRDPMGEVIIVRRDPRVAFRAVENQMNYAYLGERRSHSAAENFPIFVADLCARAESAYITPSTHSLLEHKPQGEHEFPSSQALLDYATHRLLWSWYRRDRDAQTRSDDPDWENDERTDGGTGSDVDTDEHREPS